MRRISGLACKKGKYGSSKTKVFFTMYDYKNIALPSRQLCILSGVAYRSLGRALPRWVAFGYVERRPIEFGGDFEYLLLPKARSWLRQAQKYLPNYALFLRELEAWRSWLPDDKADQLLNCGFLPFVTELDSLIKKFQARVPGK
jgi:hypothetical protein